VVDRNHDDAVSFDTLVDGVRESLQATVADGLVDRSMGLGILLDPIEDAVNFGQELLSQTCLSVLIPGIRFVDIVADARLEDEGQAH
jgi:hypothetical protein